MGGGGEGGEKEAIDELIQERILFEFRSPLEPQ